MIPWRPQTGWALLSPLPVIAVEIVQPAALLHQLNGARVVSPGGIAMEALILLSFAALHTTLVRLLHFPVGIVIEAFPRFCLTLAWAWRKKQNGRC